MSRAPLPGLVFALALCLAGFSIGGCGFFESEPEKSPDKAERPTPTTRAAAPKPEPEPEPPTAGERIEIDMAEPIALDLCIARFIALGGNRPAVLTLTSYSNAGTETYPSIQLRALVSAESPLALDGMELKGSLDFQYEQGGALWYAAEDTGVQLRVVQVTQQQIEIELTGGSLVNAQTGETRPASGNFTGAFR